MIRRPFFLVGAERSGSTMLRLMLDHHPMLACHYEFEHAVDFVEDTGEFPDLSTYIEYVNKSHLHDFSNPVIDPLLDYKDLVDSFLRQKRDQNGKVYVGATVHRHMDRLVYIWPDAVFIHLVRDPRDVARSCIRMGWDGNTWSAVGRWIEVENICGRLRQQVGTSGWHDCKYEELVDDPPRQLKKICEFIGVPYDSEMLSFVKKSTYDPPDSKLAYQWKSKASDLEIQLVENRTGEMLHRAGYEPSGFPTIAVSTKEAASLKSQSRWYRRKFRLRKYGAKLIIMDQVCKRLPFKRFRNYVEARMLAVSKKSWK